MFLFVFYVSMILFSTLLNRVPWLNPVSKVMSGWWIYEYDVSTGEMDLSVDCLQSLIMFIPYIYMFLSIFKSEYNKAKDLFWLSAKIAFLSSAFIEVTQLLFRVGTFQVADIIYNTIGGLLGAFFLVLKRRYLK